MTKAVTWADIESLCREARRHRDLEVRSAILSQRRIMAPEAHLTKLIKQMKAQESAFLKEVIMKLEKALELADPYEMISIQERGKDFAKRYRWFCKHHGHGGPWWENMSYAFEGAVGHEDLHPDVYGVEEDNVVGDQGA